MIGDIKRVLSVRKKEKRRQPKQEKKKKTNLMEAKEHNVKDKTNCIE